VRVVGGDAEVERASGRDWAEEDSSIPVTGGVDEDCDPVVVAVATLVELRLAVREAALGPDAVGCERDPQEQYRQTNRVHSSFVRSQFHLAILEKWDGESISPQLPD
jgi:hypothetical protein